MRDADDEEKTRLFDAKQGSKSAALAAEAPPSPSAAKREAAVAPAESVSDPDDEATRLINTEPDDEATRLIETDADNEPTKLVEAVGSGEWLLSRGTDPPRSVSRAQLFKEIADGTLSTDTYAWKDGMKDWQPLRAIPTLAPLLRGRMSPKVPRAAPTPLAKKSLEPLSPIAKKELETKSSLGSKGRADDSPQSRITAVSRSSATARAAAAMGDGSPGKPASSEHTVTNSSARASQSAKDSTVLVSGSMPPSDSVESSEPLLPAAEAAAQPAPPKRTSSAPPRPAAGQPPSPTELIAKAPQLVANAPPVVTAPRTHREVTQPARARLNAVTQLTHLASAAGRQQNIVLWVLGAAGWVVAGVLGGVLFAKSASEPPPPPLPQTTSETRPAPARAAPPEDPAKPEAPAVLDPAELPTAEASPPKIQRMRPKVFASPMVSAPAPAQSATAAEPPETAPEPEPAATGDTINSPGF